MALSTNKHFSLLVIGENPDELIKKYDNSIKVEPYILYYFDRMEEYHKKIINCYTLLLDLCKDDKNKEAVKRQLDYYNGIDDMQFYIELSEDGYLDETTGNVMSTNNPDGKYDKCTIGGEGTIQLVTKDGELVYSELVGNIDWEKIHLSDKKKYETAWETVVEGRKPTDEEEEKIFNNMKIFRKYFEYFDNENEYVLFSTSFNTYAVVDKDGWHELEDNMSQKEWVINFYNRYIKNLGEEEKITIFQCSRF